MRFVRLGGNVIYDSERIISVLLQSNVVVVCCEGVVESRNNFSCEKDAKMAFENFLKDLNK